MPAAEPTFNTRWRVFNPSLHLTLGPTGLHPDYAAIGESQLSENQTAQLLNHARRFAKTAPPMPPLGFDATKHVLPDGTPNIPGILADTSLNRAQKIDVYRWARVYVAGTPTDPACMAAGCIVATALPAAMLLVTGVVVLSIYLTGRQDDGCSYRRMNGTEIESLLQAVRHQFPEWANATLQNIDDWAVQIQDRFSQGIHRDRLGHLLQQVCASVGLALEPQQFLTLMLFGLLVLMA